MAAAEVVITGAGLAVPGLARAGDLLDGRRRPDGFDPATGLTGRDMRNKDRGSRLALRCSAQALHDAELSDGTSFTGNAAGTAVVVSSNLAVLERVCDFADTIARETVTALSPMGLPQTSANVIAGSVAIRYGLRGPNLTVTNGPASGLDALYWARNLLIANRAGTALVIGVEPGDDVTAKLLGEDSVDGAAALVLESAASAAARGVRPRAAMAGYAHGSDLDGAVADVKGTGSPPIGLLLTGERGSRPRGRESYGISADTSLSLQDRLGCCSGALGVLQGAAAVAYFDRGGLGAVLATAGGGEENDAASALLFTGPTA